MKLILQIPNVIEFKNWRFFGIVQVNSICFSPLELDWPKTSSIGVTRASIFPFTSQTTFN